MKISSSGHRLLINTLRKEILKQTVWVPLTHRIGDTMDIAYALKRDLVIYANYTNQKVITA